MKINILKGLIVRIMYITFWYTIIIPLLLHFLVFRDTKIAIMIYSIYICLFALIFVGHILGLNVPKSCLPNEIVLPKNEKSMYNEANAVDKRHIYDDD